ncbi:NAD(P)/FAD-dependent oxidoreductase [Streptomyces sp. NRRL B-1347]|uniref:NAD(P)/FAD-dependent oxidoreductase n=1 Tax=Streptomyces sp. NRRL B-1347 TaxID=1476877 RepID=UPI00068BC199|nr:FAD-dependent oxidoreductase [Streptomyces sp. NRRL B-1347]
MAGTAAVIGSGISGLTAAHLLRRRYAVALFEAEPRAGGHAHTHDVQAPEGGTLPVDTGFMVFNRHNYPQLMRLFGELGVQTQGSDMSMSLSCEGCSLAYLAGSALRTVPQRPAMVPEEQWGRLVGKARQFARIARSLVADTEGPDIALGELLDRSRCSADFAEHMVLPLVSALWSCGPVTARAYPARFLFRFLDQHGLLPGGAPVRWRTVKGGSRTYVRRVLERLPQVLLGLPVRAVRRTADSVEVRADDDRVRRFDRAVVAVHADQALRLLADATTREKAVLGAIPYVVNETVLHTDPRLLPSDPALRASWNVRSTCTGRPHDQVMMSNAQDLWIRLGRDVKGVPSRVIDQGH